MHAIENFDHLNHPLPPMVTVACGTRTLLVKLIQLCRVESPCFATRQGAFCTKPCQWRQDCRKPFRDWLRGPEAG